MDACSAEPVVRHRTLREIVLTLLRRRELPTGELHALAEEQYARPCDSFRNHLWEVVRRMHRNGELRKAVRMAPIRTGELRRMAFWSIDPVGPEYVFKPTAFQVRLLASIALRAKSARGAGRAIGSPCTYPGPTQRRQTRRAFYNLRVLEHEGLVRGTVEKNRMVGRGRTIYWRATAKGREFLATLSDSRASA